MTDQLIDAAELARTLDSTKVFDVRWKLGEAGHGRKAYEAGHIPGAIRVDLDADLSGPPGSRGRHPLPDPSAFARTLGRLGLARGDEVVVYDDVHGRVAARMWWMLRSIGHAEARVLEGGFRSWVDAGLPVSTVPAHPEPVDYPGFDGYHGVVEIDQLEGRNIIDVRETERYEGRHEPIDPRPGHIPGAVNLPSTLNLEEGRFKSPDALATIYGNIDAPVVSCGSGVVACHTALAIARAGLPVPDVYIGSFSEWSRTDRPVGTGPLP